MTKAVELLAADLERIAAFGSTVLKAGVTSGHWGGQVIFRGSVAYLVGSHGLGACISTGPVFSTPTVLPGDVLFGPVAAASGETVIFEQCEKRIRIRRGGFQVLVSPYNPDGAPSWPAVPPSAQKRFRILPDEWQLLTSILYPLTKLEESRPELAGVLIRKRKALAMSSQEGAVVSLTDFAGEGFLPLRAIRAIVQTKQQLTSLSWSENAVWAWFDNKTCLMITLEGTSYPEAGPQAMATYLKAATTVRLRWSPEMRGPLGVVLKRMRLFATQGVSVEGIATGLRIRAQNEHGEASEDLKVCEGLGVIGTWSILADVDKFENAIERTTSMSEEATTIVFRNANVPIACVLVKRVR